tara:strand:- start:370 stop:831 length:462 start_codon:yes stop_codon:yes gene_type:complete
MRNRHLYTLELNWSGNREVSNIGNDRLYEIQIEGKQLLKGSADEAFFGNPELYNPEDLLLSALSSCHMMSYLYVCRKQGISVGAYQDTPEGLLKVNIDGSGEFECVTLNLRIEVLNINQIELAVKLHDEAAKLCFIANSCKFKIKYNVDVYSN